MKNLTPAPHIVLMVISLSACTTTNTQSASAPTADSPGLIKPGETINGILFTTGSGHSSVLMNDQHAVFEFSPVCRKGNGRKTNP